MSKKVAFAFTLIALIASFLSYKIGSSPTVLAKSHVASQESEVSLALPTAPTTWTESWPFNGSGTPMVSKPAGGAGVKHVATCVSVHFYANTTTVINTPVSLRDGASGTGTVLAQWNLQTPGTAGYGAFVNLCDLNIVGSANTAMTLEVNPGSWGNKQNPSVNLVGYDAQ